MSTFESSYPKYTPPKWEEVKCKVDTAPPMLFSTMITKPELVNGIVRGTRHLDLDNIAYLNQLYKVHLTGGKVSTFHKTWPLPARSNLDERKREAMIIERENLDIAKLIQNAQPTVKRVAQLAAEFKANERAAEVKKMYITGKKVKTRRRGCPNVDLVATEAPPAAVVQYTTAKSCKFQDRRPRIAIEVSLKGFGRIGKMQAVLYSDYMPNTCKYFLSRCSRNSEQSYKGGKFKHIFPEFFGIIVSDADDIEWRLPHEHNNSSLHHAQAGVLSMFKGQDGFIITFKSHACMDQRYMAFGRIYKGLKTLKNIESYGTSAGYPLKSLWISDMHEL